MTFNSSLLTDGLLLAYYGDDFTGSTDVMEAFTAAGIKTVLFLEAPSESDLSKFPNIQCVGLAGQSRGQGADWMKAELPKAFSSLAQLKPRILQYKVCSTFDSSPQIGSIGQAIDIGARLYNATWTPMVVGAPRLQRYQVFGELFAGFNGQVYRIDRHPTMSQHPVTPMNEGDLRIHLSRQTSRRIELIDMGQMERGESDKACLALMGDDAPVVMLDVANTGSQCEAGRLVWENAQKGIFSASSSGLQYALVAYWRQLGLLSNTSALPSAPAVPAIAVVSGSCSPMSGNQIDWAQANGFQVERLNIAKCLSQKDRDVEIERVVNIGLEALKQGQSPLVYSAKGPNDPAVINFDSLVEQYGLTKLHATQQIGLALAEVMRQWLNRSDVKRIVVAGGDSSGAVASHLDIQALTVTAGLSPGVPLCRAWSKNSQRDGLEIALKGGQLGSPSFYGEVLAGTA